MGTNNRERRPEWKSKGLDWCVNKLAIKTDELERVRNRCRNLQEQLSKIKIESTVYEENQNLAEVLQANGIRPKRLRITYTSSDCETCQHYDVDEACDFDSSYCNFKHFVESTGFYTYKIVDGYFEGIRSDFAKKSLYVKSVVDEDTGKTIWEEQ